MVTRSHPLAQRSRRKDAQHRGRRGVAVSVGVVDAPDSADEIETDEQGTWLTTRAQPMRPSTGTGLLGKLERAFGAVQAFQYRLLPEGRAELYVVRARVSSPLPDLTVEAVAEFDDAALIELPAPAGIVPASSSPGAALRATPRRPGAPF